MFSLKTSNIMEGSKLGYQAWAIANYLVTTSLKGVSSRSCIAIWRSRKRPRGIWHTGSARSAVASGKARWTE